MCVNVHWEHLFAGIMLESEQKILEDMSSADTNLYFVPLVWAASLVNRARKEGRIKDDFSVKTLIDVCASLLSTSARLMVAFPLSACYSVSSTL